MKALALGALLLAACDVVQVDQRPAPAEPARYVVELDAPTPPRALEVEAVARCDEGDLVVAGGCAWGDVVDAHDQPLRPLVDAPDEDGAGWRCVGQATGVGASLKVLRASAVCEVGR